MGGGMLWLCGRSHSVYAGASGVIFTFWGYLLAIPWFEPQFHWLSFVVAVAVGLVYSSLLLGVFPHGQDSGDHGMAVAWEAHLFGFLAGLLWAYITGKFLNGEKLTYEKIQQNEASDQF